MPPKVQRQHASWLETYRLESHEPTLELDQVVDASRRLSIPTENIQAVIMKESSGEPAGPDGKATILFEPHLFSRFTQGRYDRAFPSISYPKQSFPRSRRQDHAYNTTQGQRWGLLLFAASLDYLAAVKATSFGMFQILGMNYELCGCQSATQFVVGMHVSEVRQFQLWLTFIKATGLHEPLRQGDWLGFALGYNLGRNWKNPANRREPPAQARRYAAQCARLAASAQHRAMI